MERDFMGLSSKEEVTDDGFKDSAAGFNTGSAIHWPFANRVSALPHLMSFKVGQEDKTKKIVTEPLLSSGFMPIDASDSTHRHPMGDFQKSLNQSRQGGTHFSMTAYPAQHDVHFVHRTHDMKMFPVSNQGLSVSMGNPFFNNHFATMKQQLLGGIPVTAPPSVLPIAGITEPWNSANDCAPPAQLTIFYGGQVNVYDDISAEKAQAIMFLAGNALPMSSNSAHPKAQVQSPSSKPASGDSDLLNLSMNSTPCSGLASPLSVSSHTGVQSQSGSTSTDEQIAAKSSRVATIPVSNAEPSGIVNAMGSINTTTMIPSVPQARKASLARFLEKRKERVMNAAPYNFSKKPQECANQAALA